MSVRVRIYHGTPVPCRSLLASLHGWALERWRYGHRGDALATEMLQRDSWSAADWATWQQTRLAEVLAHAARHVPYYRDYWQRQAPPVRPGEPAPWLQLANWPVLRKDTVRTHSDLLSADNIARRDCHCDSTSGTTGTPLRITHTQATAGLWFAMFEARVRRWHNVSRHERWAILGGQMIVPVTRREPPFWIHNYWGHQLYLSAHHVSAANARHYAAALTRFRPTHLIVYPSSATVLADAILDQRLTVPPLRVLFSNSETLLPRQRERLAAAFQCPVVNTYGSGEMCVAASECAHGSLHLWPDAGVVEVLEDAADRPAAPGATGRLVVTGLSNDAMPLIRYEIGDRGAVAPPGPVCACGRALPVLQTLEGRTNDLITALDGRRVFWLNPVFYGLPVCEAQIVQTSRTAVEVRLVAAAGFGPDTAAEIRRRLAERVGSEMSLTIMEVAAIPRDASGKFRAVISLVSP